MKNHLSLPPVLLLVALLLSCVATTEAAGEQRLRGRYDWPAGDSRGPLEAVFTPTGPARWDVAFHFTFSDRDRTYRGTAEGSLSTGRLAGRVKSENGRQTYSFEGEFRDGTFTGTHAEVRRYGERATGTLSLSPPPATR